MVNDRCTVTVSGAGAATTPPDRALVSLSAEARAENPSAALAACSVAVGAMVDAALAEGVLRSAVQTSGLSLQPWWDHGVGEPRLAGYQAADSLSMWVAELDRIGALLAAVVAAGGEAARVNGVSLVVGDPAPAMAAARQAAFRDARTKAEQYAALAGGELGVLLSVQEDDRGGHRPLRLSGWQAQAASADVHVEPGENRLTVDLTVVWELVLAN